MNLAVLPGDNETIIAGTGSRAATARPLFPPVVPADETVRPDREISALARGRTARNWSVIC